MGMDVFYETTPEPQFAVVMLLAIVVCAAICLYRTRFRFTLRDLFFWFTLATFAMAWLLDRSYVLCEHP
jgi:hypothetical protein